jgi:IS4 transposase
MALEAIMERFKKSSPLTVMVRLVMQQALSREWMEEVFERNRGKQYTRELMFSTVVDLMGLVALGLKPSLHAAAQASPELGVSLTALYDKVKRTEPEVVGALVRGSAERLAPVVKPMRQGREPWATGYVVRVLDGNHLAASEKRMKQLREFRGAALPGQSLVVYAPELDLVVDVVPAEDAHAQERALMGPVLEQVQPGELWLADRNFSTTRILFGIHDKKAAFVIREHGASPNPTPLEPPREVGRVETGLVYEQAVRIEDETGRQLTLRRIELHLDEPTRHGESVIRLLTDVLPERMGAQEVAGLYRRRWSIESMFGRLESVLQSEVKSLGYPRAALFAFGVSVLAYNVLAVLQSAVEAEHRLEDSTIQVSSYYIADEVKSNYGGMMIALPEPTWQEYESQSAPELSRTLLGLAANVKVARLRKHPRKPKKKTKKEYVPAEVARRHIATARVLRGQEQP